RHDGPEIYHLGPAINIFHANRVLHKSIGGQDEICRDNGTCYSKPQHGKVDSYTNSTPSEYPDADKDRFQKECEESFHGQWGTKYVTNKTRVFTPSHTKLEFLDQTGSNPQDAVSHEDVAPALRPPQVLFFARPMPCSLHRD